MITSGIVTSLGKVSAEVAARVEKIEKYRNLVVNMKVIGDFLLIVGLLIVPKYTWLFAVLYCCGSTIGYGAIVLVTRYSGHKIIKEFESLASTKNGAKLNETAQRLKVFLRTGWISEIPIRILVIGTIWYWGTGKYNPENNYPRPSLAMAFFVNGMALLESSILIFFMQLYFQFSMGNVRMNGKETFLLSLLSRVMVSRSKGESDIVSSQTNLEIATRKEP